MHNQESPESGLDGLVARKVAWKISFVRSEGASALCCELKLV